MASKRQVTSVLGSGLVWSCAGLAAGAGLVLAVALGLFVHRLLNPLTPPAAPMPLPATRLPPTAVSFPTAWPIWTATPRPLPTAPVQPAPTQAGPDVLDTAEQALNDGDLQRAIDLLTPELDHLTQASDLARAYTCLAQAEMQLDHFQFAAAYFDELYSLQPTAEHLAWLAASYDMGGDLKHALEKYQALVAMTGTDADQYRAEASSRVASLQDVVHHTPVAPTP